MSGPGTVRWSPLRRVSAIAGFAAAVALLAWLAGFVWFLHVVGGTTEIPAHTNGIVAFTGGPDRVETALRLLDEGRADQLLLSGIGGGAELPELAHLAGLRATPLYARVTIGRNATTTRGNAIETAAWARAAAIQSLLVVTSSYHMPRAMAELSHELSDVRLYPVPVSTGRATPLRLLAEEYVKYLMSISGLTGLLPAKEVSSLHVARVG
jgi:uncharacterized SAM-binding protein YcdF (DUF218 family)